MRDHHLLSSLKFTSEAIRIKAAQSLWPGFILACILKMKPENSSSSSLCCPTEYSYPCGGGAKRWKYFFKNTSRPKLFNALPKKRRLLYLHYIDLNPFQHTCRQLASALPKMTLSLSLINYFSPMLLLYQVNQ